MVCGWLGSENLLCRSLCCLLLHSGGWFMIYLEDASHLLVVVVGSVCLLVCDELSLSVCFSGLFCFVRIRCYGCVFVFFLFANCVLDWFCFCCFTSCWF